jgi:hypothetical protein
LAASHGQSQQKVMPLLRKVLPLLGKVLPLLGKVQPLLRKVQPHFWEKFCHYLEEFCHFSEKFATFGNSSAREKFCHFWEKFCQFSKKFILEFCISPIIYPVLLMQNYSNSAKLLPPIFPATSFFSPATFELFWQKFLPAGNSGTLYNND